MATGDADGDSEEKRLNNASVVVLGMGWNLPVFPGGPSALEDSPSRGDRLFPTMLGNEVVNTSAAASVFV